MEAGAAEEEVKQEWMAMRCPGRSRHTNVYTTPVTISNYISVTRIELTATSIANPSFLPFLCFFSVAFSLAAQNEEICSLIQKLLTDIGEDRQIAHKLRLLSVAEWMEHMDEYKGFLDGDQSVADEYTNLYRGAIFMTPWEIQWS